MSQKDHYEAGDCPSNADEDAPIVAKKSFSSAFLNRLSVLFLEYIALNHLLTYVLSYYPGAPNQSNRHDSREC